MFKRQRLLVMLRYIMWVLVVINWGLAMFLRFVGVSELTSLLRDVSLFFIVFVVDRVVDRFTGWTYSDETVDKS